MNKIGYRYGSDALHMPNSALAIDSNSQGMSRPIASTASIIEPGMGKGASPEVDFL